MKWLINVFLGSLLAAAVLFVATFSPSIDLLARLLHVESNVQEADVIVVLSSSNINNCDHHPHLLDREFLGAKLLRLGMSRSQKIILTGHYVDPKVMPVKDCIKKLAARLQIPAYSIDLDNNAYSTYENALRAKAMIKKHHWRDIVLVTAKSHMRRALWVFEKQGIQAYPATVADRPAQTDKWFDINRIAYLRRFLYEYGAILHYKCYGYL